MKLILLLNKCTLSNPRVQMAFPHVSINDLGQWCMRRCKAALDFLNHDCFDNSINSTNIVLIPKKKTPNRIIDYRPISLYNVLHKLIAKVLANRMKHILVQIISPTQRLCSSVDSSPTIYWWLLRRSTRLNKNKRAPRVYGPKIGHEQGL
jgi:hypothetical protein